MKKTCIGLVVIAIMILTSSSVQGQLGGGYEIKSWSVNSGGTSSEGNFVLDWAAGQIDAGVHAAGNFTINGGFFQSIIADVPVTPQHNVYLPFVVSGN